MSRSHKILLIILVALIGACSHTRGRDHSICESDQPHTIYNVSDYSVRIFGPNDHNNPNIWEGPLCIQNDQTGSRCVKYYSLIKQVKIDTELDLARITLFSGSNSEIKQVSISSCKELE